jgi:Cyclic nucleotide-binding domain
MLVSRTVLGGEAMNIDNLVLAAISTHVAPRVTESNATTELLTRLGFDPSDFTFGFIYNRLIGIAAAGINLANMFALAGAIFFVATLLMRTIVPLRIAAIISDVFFIGYGVLANSITTFILYCLLLPINSVRLYQMVKLVRKARVSAQGDLSIDWLKPFMVRRTYSKGDVLFRKGDPANEMFFTVTGKFLVTEIGVEISPGRLVGELGFLSPDNRRTQTVECLDGGEVLTMTYDKLLQLYFQNPEFGYFFLRLSSERLLQNIARLERIIEQHRIKLAEYELILASGSNK